MAEGVRRAFKLALQALQEQQANKSRAEQLDEQVRTSGEGSSTQASIGGNSSADSYVN